MHRSPSMLDQVDRWGLRKNWEWIQCEKSFLQACMPLKELTSTSMLTRNLAGERFSDIERPSIANNACSHVGSRIRLCEKTGVLCNASAPEKQPELTRE